MVQYHGTRVQLHLGSPFNVDIFSTQVPLIARILYSTSSLNSRGGGATLALLLADGGGFPPMPLLRLGTLALGSALKPRDHRGLFLQPQLEGLEFLLPHAEVLLQSLYHALEQLVVVLAP